MQQLTSCPICNSTSIGSFIETSAQMHSDKELFNFDQCADCQLVFLNPRVPLDQLKNYYTSHYLPYRGAKAWGRYEQLVENSQRKLDAKRVKRVKKAHAISSESLILDIGCGKPSFLKACQKELNCKTMGIDFSDEGWKDQPDHFDGVDLQIAEIKDLTSSLKPDVITMWHYLEHDYTPLENLSYLKSISKPSTTLVIEIPNFDSTSRKKYGENWAGWHTPRHISLFSPNNIELLLQKSGWKVTKLMAYGTMNHYMLYWMSEMEQKGIKWDKNMQDEFWEFMRGMILFMPKKWKEKKSSLGIMTVIATPQ
ncbi:class I SAM-dependent methyltransferase [Psychroflexus gondwanensis]|jgi:2-polyprenyl-3-methyl-5-hydroxy-6-metoxy-1,4-benzoquinol methylase|uniref:SAM-dependent methyltransferase n=1 Tax=Psychroflexus gondwanensis ACAM 44 TaxID=1189619 RepID=N1WNM0_9FLAO|nr:class I SAM-dependent methyltransferase [Psychroflexus gondwanensis]EMY80570.1 SAM-dependent methyltransferase [Psychroflexus gondwanensis ACAM 44]TXE20517.1 class I SAM-dependent methyltransferase [Psychroflexus gondwanensis]